MLTSFKEAFKNFYGVDMATMSEIIRRLIAILGFIYILSCLYLTMLEEKGE